MYEILGAVGIALNLIFTGATVMIFCVVKFNDLKHLEEGQKRIETNQAGMDKKLDKVGERISTIEGKCVANHGV